MVIFDYFRKRRAMRSTIQMKMRMTIIIIRRIENKMKKPDKVGDQIGEAKS